MSYTFDGIPDADNLISMFKPDVALRIRKFILLDFTVQIPYADAKALKAEYHALKEIIQSNFAKATAKMLIRQVIKPVYRNLKRKLEG